MIEDLKIKAGYVIDQLGWCGCGAPVSARESLFEILSFLDYRSEESHDKRFERQMEFEAKHGRGLVMMLYYFLNHAGVTEHGGSVPGWLTEEGQALVDYLRLVGCKDGEYEENGIPVHGTDPWEMAQEAYWVWRDTEGSKEEGVGKARNRYKLFFGGKRD